MANTQTYETTEMSMGHCIYMYFGLMKHENIMSKTDMYYIDRSFVKKTFYTTDLLTDP